MRHETIRENYKRNICLNAFNIATVNTWKRIIKIALSIVLLSIFAIGQSSAEVWFDTFKDKELNGWERTAEHNAWNAQWRVEDGIGILFSRIQRPRAHPRCEKNAADFLRWIPIRFLLFERLTVIGKEMVYPQEGDRGMGELCLFFGKQRNVHGFFAVEGYIVSPEETSKVTFSEKDDYSRGETKASYGNKFPFTTNHLKVVFDSGQFQVFTDEVLLTEFIDEDLRQIDVVGLLITCHFGGELFDARISSFSISGDGIPNHNHLAVQLQGTQLTTTWGRLKRFE